MNATPDRLGVAEPAEYLDLMPRDAGGGNKNGSDTDGRWALLYGRSVTGEDIMGLTVDQPRDDGTGGKEPDGSQFGSHRRINKACGHVPKGHVGDTYGHSNDYMDCKCPVSKMGMFSIAEFWIRLVNMVAWIFLGGVNNVKMAELPWRFLGSTLSCLW